MFSICCMFILAFAGPTISFSSLNTQFFTKRQIALSIGLATFLGALMGIAGALALRAWPSAWLPPVLGAIACACFIILNERFFTETIASKKARYVVYGILPLLFVSPCALGWPGITAGLLAIYAIFAFYDLLKNWNRPKTPLFDPKLLKPSKTRDIIKFQHRPNIYLLLLESMHSSEALEKAYGIKSSAAEDCLAGRGFAIYPHTLSNKHLTPLSLKTLLSMSLDYNADAETLDQFVANGYKCYFFDSMFYLSQPYIKYVSNKNAKMPPWVYKLYSCIGPFAAQSKWLRKLAGNIDPFETSSGQIPFNTMKNAFQEHLASQNKEPSFNILHFGAEHFGDIWYNVHDAANTYMRSYNIAVQRTREIVDIILENDPGAIIVAAGDHGSYHWHGACDGKDMPDENARRNGIDPGNLVFDFFGVLLGIHWGNIQKPDIQILSHVNIFRYILAALSGKSVPEEMLAENISILNGKVIAARDGKPLNQFEPLSNAAYADFYARAAQNTELFQTCADLDLQIINKDFANLEERARNVLALANAASPLSGQHSMAAISLAKAGFISQAADMLDNKMRGQEAGHGYDKLSLLARLRLAMRDYARAIEVLDKGLANPLFPKREFLYFKALALWGQEKYNDILDLIPVMLATPPNRNYEVNSNIILDFTSAIMAIDKAKGHVEAEKWIGVQMEKYKRDKTVFYTLIVQKLALKLKYDQKGGIAWMRKLTQSQLGTPEMLLLLQRLQILAGDLDGARELDQAMDCYLMLADHPLRNIMREEILPKGSKERVMAITTSKALAGKIEASGLFDEEWYVKTYKPAGHPVMDYIKNGVALLRNPNPDFDTFFYFCAVPEICLNGNIPLLYQTSADGALPVSIADAPLIRALANTNNAQGG